jgi:hypothetical protein
MPLSIRKRRWTLRTAVIAALVVSSVPAGAAVLVSNFMTANVSRNAACLTKIAGLDNAPAIVTTNVTSTASGTASVALLNESITLKSFAGDRSVATDSIRIKNNCSASIKVTLKAEPGLAAATTSGDWSALAMNVYLGTKMITSAGTLNPALSGTDFTVATDWDATPLRITPPVSPATAGVVTAATSGTVTITAGSEIQLGVIADSGSAAPTTGTAVLNYTVQATQ